MSKDNREAATRVMTGMPDADGGRGLPVARSSTPIRSVNKRALFNALMRCCFKAERLDAKCARLGITDTGLGQAAREFRWAAEKVEAMIKERS